MIESIPTVVRKQDFHAFEKLAEQSNSRPVWVQVGQLFDGLRDQTIRNANLVFDSEHILFVGVEGEQPSPELLGEGMSQPDAILPEHFVLPCLIEAHAHMFLDGAPVDFSSREQYLKESPEWMLARAKKRRLLLLQCGVGTVRDAGDKHGVGLALAKEAKTFHGTSCQSAWIDSPGAAIHHRGRYGKFMAEPLEDHPDAASCVISRVARGADRIKLLVSGIINFKVGQVTAPPQMNSKEVAELVQAAHDHNRQTFAHASGTSGIQNAIDGGVATVEHGFFVTEEQLKKMRDRGIGWVPTFAPVQLQIDQADELGWESQIVDQLKRIIGQHQRMLSLGHQIGVTIVAGSDAGSCGVAHGLGFLSELEQMEQAGMPSVEVLKSATGVSNRLLRFAEPVGQIAPRSRARLLFTCHDPLETVANLQKDRAILFDGVAVQGRSDLSTEGL